MIEPSPMPISRLFSNVMRVLRDAALDGQGLLEYALVLLFVSVAAIGAIGLFGTGVHTLYQTLLDGLPF